MNQVSEQITLTKCLVKDHDQPLSSAELQDSLMNALGRNNCRVLRIPKNKWCIEYRNNNKIYHILAKSCTYLGNPHPIYKKRIQLSSWFNEYANDVARHNPQIDVRYIGVYRYDHVDYGKNIIFIDFEKDTYLLKKGNNSSAHVYMNDLYQGMTYGVFQKEDALGNTINVVREDHFFGYLTGEKSHQLSLFDLFREFNNGFTFGEWVEALDVIKEMHQHAWYNWRQAEWAGAFLEYKFNKFTEDNHCTRQMRYVGGSLKGKYDLDFDIKFEEDNFYGDLKASDIKQRECIGNDQQSMIDCLFRDNKFWYVIYEHETIKDSQMDYEATRARNHFIKDIDSKYFKDEMSYHQRMKHSVKFVKMSIVELNMVNYKDILTTFKQGRQPDGSARNPKFSINKSMLKNDNFVVFRYSYYQHEIF